MICKAYCTYNEQLMKNTKFLSDPTKYTNLVLNKLKEANKTQ